MTASRARAVLDLDVTGVTISRHLYGHFAEHLGRCIYGDYVGGPSPTWAASDPTSSRPCARCRSPTCAGRVDVSPNHGENRLYRIAAGAADDDLSWTRALMEAISCLGCAAEPRGILQGISFHHYTHAGNGIAKESATEFSDQQYYATMAHAADIDRVIAGHSAVMDSYDPRRRIGLVCDEWAPGGASSPRRTPGPATNASRRVFCW